MNTSIDGPYDLITTVDLNNREKNGKPVYQFVYGSQAYGTVFGIYAQFDVRPIQGGTACNVTGVSLLLINYQGLMNIGFTQQDPVYVDNASEIRPEIYIGVKGMSRLREKKITLTPELIIKKNDPLRLTFKRILYRLDDFNTNAHATQSENGFGYPRRDKTPDFQVFDTEFYSRDGDDYFDNPLRPGMAGHDHLTLETVGQGNFASPRCTQSDVNLLY